MANWKHGLFGCFGNISVSLLACMLTPFAAGKNAEAIGEKEPILWTCAILMLPCIGGALLRGQIRKKSEIEGSFYADVLAWLLCPLCALCQDTLQTGSLDYLVAPEMQIVQRETAEPEPKPEPEAKPEPESSPAPAAEA